MWASDDGRATPFNEFNECDGSADDARQGIAASEGQTIESLESQLSSHAKTIESQAAIIGGLEVEVEYSSNKV